MSHIKCHWPEGGTTHHLKECMLCSTIINMKPIGINFMGLEICEHHVALQMGGGIEAFANGVHISIFGGRCGLEDNPKIGVACL